MINRVLIRIKVVQMLYCHLLTRGVFKLRQAPENPSRDKSFAYSVYCDLLLLLVRLSGLRTAPSNCAIAEVDDNRYLRKNRIAQMLAADSEIKGLGAKVGDLSDKYGDAIFHLYKQITTSSAYRSYIRRKNHDLTGDVTFWVAMFQTVFAKSSEFLEAVRKSDKFTIAGFEQGLQMAVESIEQLTDTKSMFVNARNALDRSLGQSYRLYHLLLALPGALTHAEELRLDSNRNKFLATADDLNPNTKFVDNELVKALRSNPAMEEYFAANPFSWADEPELLRALLKQVTESDIYRAYMESPSSGLQADCDFWRSIMRNVVLPSDLLGEWLEGASVYWNDDLEIVGTFVLKTIKRVASGIEPDKIVLPQFKDQEDAAFGGELFVDTVENFDLYRGYIDRFIDTRQWDSERLAFMDVVIMATAISELLNYPAIPIPVTLNEYIEIANSYSTPRSGQFINGLLYSVINCLKDEGRINKD